MQRILKYSLIFLLIGMINLESKVTRAKLPVVSDDDYPSISNKAFRVPLNSTIKGYLEIKDDDWFKFELKKIDGITIYAKGGKDALMMDIIDNNGKYLLSEKLIYSSSFHLAFKANLEPGIYYIRLYNGSFEDTDYTFSINIFNNDSNITLDGATIAYCRKYPDKCGIKLKSLTEVNISKLKKGWHLLGTSKEITNFSNFNNVKAIWSWENGWKGYSPNPHINQIFQNSPNINKMDKIEANKGFWILKE